VLVPGSRSRCFWILEKLRGDRRLLVHAAAEAQDVADFILNRRACAEWINLGTTKTAIVYGLGDSQQLKNRE